MHDLVIRGALIVDGTGGPARTGDIAADAAKSSAWKARRALARVRSTPTG